jgi:hypothetical protein
MVLFAGVANDDAIADDMLCHLVKTGKKVFLFIKTINLDNGEAKFSTIDYIWPNGRGLDDLMDRIIEYPTEEDNSPG